MLQPGSILKVADNSGAKELKVITIIGSKNWAEVGDVVSGSVQGVTSGESEVSDHEVVRAVVVRTKKEKRRKDGSYIRFDDNACVILDKRGLLLGTRVLGPVAREVRKSGFVDVASKAPEVI
ncbi:MAG: 50S ribosomal protein L14 [Patescibacteria group bacterium]|nr:50S ribosomal protein L14 [Patescibacteria group bacterium]